MNATTLFASQFLEFIAGFSFVVAVGLAAFMCWYIARTLKWRQPEPWWAMWGSPSLKIGWSLMVLAIGESINRGLVWYTRHIENHTQIANGWDQRFTIIATFAAAISAWGALCALRITTPANVGERPWLIVVLFAFLFSALSAYGDFF